MKPAKFPFLPTYDRLKPMLNQMADQSISSFPSKGRMMSSLLDVVVKDTTELGADHPKTSRILSGMVN